MASAHPPSVLQGKRVLIVEDEFILATEIAAYFEEEGCVVLGPAPIVARALFLLEHEAPDAVVLDVNLNGERSTALVEILQRRGIPFVVVTGYDRAQLTEPAFRTAPRLDKPFRWSELLGALSNQFPALTH